MDHFFRPISSFFKRQVCSSLMLHGWTQPLTRKAFFTHALVLVPGLFQETLWFINMLGDGSSFPARVEDLNPLFPARIGSPPIPKLSSVRVASSKSQDEFSPQQLWQISVMAFLCPSHSFSLYTCPSYFPQVVCGQAFNVMKIHEIHH